MSELLFNIIKQRRSIRKYLNKPIDDYSIRKILEAGVYAPTGSNQQELRFFILKKKENIKLINKFKPNIHNPALCILVFYDSELPYYKKYRKIKHKQRLPFIDAGACVQNMLLAAKALGIGSCFINVSEYLRRSPGNLSKSKYIRFVQKVWEKLLYYMGKSKYSLKYVIYKKLRIPTKYVLLTGVFMGYPEEVPDIEKYKHFGPIKRKTFDHYIIGVK